MTSKAPYKDRGIFEAIYFRDPLGQLFELSSYKFVPPEGVTHVEVLMEAHQLRVERGDYNITEPHLADAIENLTRKTRPSLSKDRSPKNPYPEKVARELA